MKKLFFMISTAICAIMPFGKAKADCTCTYDDGSSVNSNWCQYSMTRGTAKITKWDCGTSVTDYEYAGDTINSITKNYNSSGEVVSETIKSGLLDNYTYESSQTYTCSNGSCTQTAAKTMEFDDYGNALSSKNYICNNGSCVANGSAMINGYDAAGHLQNVSAYNCVYGNCTQTIYYDAANRMNYQCSNGTCISDANGRTITSYNNGIRTDTNTYCEGSSCSTWKKKVYGYDAAGNWTSLTQYTCSDGVCTPKEQCDIVNYQSTNCRTCSSGGCTATAFEDNIPPAVPANNLTNQTLSATPFCSEGCGSCDTDRNCKTCNDGYKKIENWCNRVRYTPAEAAKYLTDDNNNVVTLTFRK